MTTLPPLLNGLDQAALERLGIFESRFAVPNGDYLFRQGQPTSGVYVIESGRIALVGRTPGDGEVVIGELGAGESVGELSLLDQGVRSASARVLDDCCGWRLSLDRFHPLAQSGDVGAHILLDRMRLEVAERTRSTLIDIGPLLDQGAGAPRAIGDLPPPTAGAPGDMAALLHSFPGFDAFDAADWADLGACVARVDVPRGTLLARAGEAATALMLVARGAIRASLPNLHGAEQIFLYGPGSFAGLAPMLDGAPRLLHLDMREDGVVFLIGGDALQQLRRGESPFARMVMRQAGLQMVRDLRRLSRIVGRLQRVAGRMG
ncbi:MAG: cyclic nucleotide-binding domain-containing protein [Sphingomonadaceae bacterium]|nr:cyclic nucleotide-binding domain-containing protein [Sphingomonadaceae bacterium]